MPDVNIRPLQIRFNSQYSKYFDAIYNCQLSNRISDTWQVETDRPMIWPREWTRMVWNTLAPAWNGTTTYTTWQYVSYNWLIYKAISWSTWSAPPWASWSMITTWTSKQFFYTDRTWNRRHYKVFDNILYYLNWNTWTSLWDIWVTDVEFANHRVPLNNNWLDSSNHTVTSWTTQAEQVIRWWTDALDSNNNVWSIVLITSGLFKWCYAPIIAYDTWTWAYTLWWAWLITGTPAWTTYKRYNRVADVLQISRWSADLWELYFDWVTPMTWYTWYTTESLVKVSALASWKWLRKLVSFNNYCWTFSWSTLYYTGWYPWNPLFYNYTWALTVSSNWTILDIFVYKTRLIIIWTSFIFSITTWLQVDRHVTSFWWVKDWYVNTWWDVYILTTARTLVSLKETIAWVVEVNNNFWKEIENYLTWFTGEVCFWYDSYRVYMYWASGSSDSGIMCVLDTTYDYWFIYDNINPRSIITEWWITYISDRNTDIVRRFDQSIDRDDAVWWVESIPFTQSILIKEIDYWDIFSQKILEYIQFSCENFTQEFRVDVYTALNNINWKKSTQKISLDAIAVWWGALWEWNLWKNTFWQSWMLDIISVPRLKQLQYSADSANIFKILLTWIWWLYFYLSQIDIWMWFDWVQKSYFDPSNSK